MKHLIVILGAVGASSSAVFVRWSSESSAFLVFWRVFLAALLLLPSVLLHREELRALTRRTALLCLTSGAFLGFHFLAYFESLRYTSIAASVTLANTEVFFVALGSVLLFHQRLPGKAWGAILLTFAGSVLVALTGTEVSGTLGGNLLALGSALLMTVYTVIGSICRRTLSTTLYTALVYLSAAGTILAASLLTSTPVVSAEPFNYLLGLGMAVCCTLMGHSIYSWGLKYLPASYISTVKLMDPVFSAVWGLLLFGEGLSPSMLLGGAAVILGVALYIRITEQKDVSTGNRSENEKESLS